MKRKVRRKRQIRLQLLKQQIEQDSSDYLCEQLLEEKLNRHSYYQLSENQHYAFICLIFHYGMELYEPKTFYFLLNRMTNTIRYSYYTNIDKIYEETGNELIHENVFIDDMFDCYPFLPQKVYDSSSYEIFIKSGQRKRVINIASSNSSKYVPYQWLFKLLDRIVGK